MLWAMSRYQPHRDVAAPCGDLTNHAQLGNGLMTTKVMLLAGLIAVASAGALRAQQPADTPSLFAKTCASCHGAKGTPAAAMAHAMPGLPDFAAASMASVPDSVLKDAIANGKGRIMQSYKARLTTEQIAALVAYIRTFKH